MRAPPVGPGIESRVCCASLDILRSRRAPGAAPAARASGLAVMRRRSHGAATSPPPSSIGSAPLPTRRWSSRGGEASGRLVGAEPSRLPRPHAVSRAGVPIESVFDVIPREHDRLALDADRALRRHRHGERRATSGPWRGPVPKHQILANRRAPRALASCPPVPPGPIDSARGRAWDGSSIPCHPARFPPPGDVVTGCRAPRRRRETMHAIRSGDRANVPEHGSPVGLVGCGPPRRGCRSPPPVSAVGASPGCFPRWDGDVFVPPRAPGSPTRVCLFHRSVRDDRRGRLSRAARIG